MTYTVREGSCCLPGMLFSVPVKNRQESGLILRLQTRPPQKFQARPLGQPLSADRVLTRPALALLRWVSRHYVCSLNRTANLFLPPPIRRKKEMRYFWIENGQGEVHPPCPSPAVLFGSSVGQTLWQALLKAGDQGLAASRIKARFGLMGLEQAESWLHSGYLTASPEWRQGSKIQQVLWLRPTDLCQDQQARAQLQRRAPKQGALLDVLLDLDFQKELGSTWTALQAQAGWAKPSKTLLQGLIEKGFVRAGLQQSRRNPLANPLEGGLSQGLEPQQQAALGEILQTVNQGCYGAHLLFGVTGSGKTEVYFQAAAQVIAQGRQVLYLVPEISLVPQLAAKAKAWFGESVAILHSSLTAGQRFDEWQRIQQGQAQLVLGSRSALFAPMANLGFIIIDEEHEHTYKQSEPEPRYDARDTAKALARFCGATLVRGSATPDLTSYYQAQLGKQTLSCLTDRIQGRPMPPIQWIDMAKEMREGRPYPVSKPLLEALQVRLTKGEQAILLMNRRGFHTYVLCRDCGKSLECPHCSIAMTYHRSNGRLICHYCGHQENLPSRCPHCGGTALQYMGTGTERVVDFIMSRLPTARILRMDMDSTSQAGSHTEILRQFQLGQADILVGTQMVAKGFDFARVTLAGILHIDGVLNLPDFQSSERAFQLMVQTAGRAGRGQWPGQVMVQTFFVGNPVLQAVETYDYQGFYQREMALRQALGYPPFTYLARILVSGLDEGAVQQCLEELNRHCRRILESEGEKINWLGPTKAPLEKIKNRWRYHLILVSQQWGPLRRALAAARQRALTLGEEPRIILDMEPKSIL